MTTENTTAQPRSARLRALSQSLHDSLEHAVAAYAPFDSRESYGHFLQMQYLFQSQLKALYQDPALVAIFPDLPGRCRADAALADLADLGVPVPAELAGAPSNLSQAQALTWIRVSEGSKLGAAILIKRANALGLDKDFGARHLAEPEGGRMPAWKAFNQVFDALPFTAAEEAEADQAVIDAFSRLQVLLRHTYAGQPETV
ncbi:biliverdin-producing heme oxygenase [Pseudomonas sp. HR96]|uniref:biliverdin-producing heme oxygenase n=1 Tax=Pseudomonas sp. HR96 TaxID=1027966 RepID=UPI002A7505EC|nr:biliverdin-producing heme oxygenase [Pseudomonas sp. HR96]WPO99266.1 biliverdin-producing heme oxygenase [Pseudomonas sp. HR96]